MALQIEAICSLLLLLLHVCLLDYLRLDLVLSDYLVWRRSFLEVAVLLLLYPSLAIVWLTHLQKPLRLVLHVVDDVVIEVASLLMLRLRWNVLRVRSLMKLLLISQILGHVYRNLLLLLLLLILFRNSDLTNLRVHNLNHLGQWLQHLLVVSDLLLGVDGVVIFH